MSVTIYKCVLSVVPLASCFWYNRHTKKPRAREREKKHVNSVSFMWLLMRCVVGRYGMDFIRFILFKFHFRQLFFGFLSRWFQLLSAAFALIVTLTALTLLRISFSISFTFATLLNRIWCPKIRFQLEFRAFSVEAHHFFSLFLLATREYWTLWLHYGLRNLQWNRWEN